MTREANPLFPRLFAVVLLGLVASAALRGGACFRAPLRVGTFNIEHFGTARTNVARLAELIDSTDADVLGVQEIEDIGSARRLMPMLSRRAGRRFELVLTKCGGRSKMLVGFFYNAERVRLVSTAEHQELDPDPSDKCLFERPGLSAKFEPVSADDGSAFQLLVFHLIPGSEPWQQEARRKQWKKAHVIAAKLGNETPVAILGDANSTGFRDDAGGERTFIVNEAKGASLDVVTSDVGCTEYYRLKPSDPLTPSLLDHFVATPGLARRGSARVHGYCAALACKQPSEDPSDFKTVSDHCPVTIDL